MLCMVHGIDGGIKLPSPPPASTEKIACKQFLCKQEIYLIKNFRYGCCVCAGMGAGVSIRGTIYQINITSTEN